MSHTAHLKLLGYSNKKNDCEKHVAHVGEKRNNYTVLVGKPERNRPVEDLGIFRKALLKLTLNK